MSDENVGGLVELPAKWRLRMAHADAMEKSCADEANKNWWSGVSQQAEECADELEAALSVSESKICGLAERMSELIYRAERTGYVVIKPDELRRISSALSAHGQPVVDEAMVDRAINAYAEIADDCMGVVRKKAIRAALTAALTGADHE